MPSTESSSSVSRTLRLAAVTEVVFLAVSAFLLFTEHRAHYLGALPYALLVVAVTVFLWFFVERRKRHVGSGSDVRKGCGFHA